MKHSMPTRSPCAKRLSSSYSNLSKRSRHYLRTNKNLTYKFQPRQTLIEQNEGLLEAPSLPPHLWQPFTSNYFYTLIESF